MSATVARPVALIVLDGWGYREDTTANAIALANTPNWDALWAQPSRTLLTASGRAVGLPDGQMGNSEVGHMNLGAGRVVMQDLMRIKSAIEDGSFFTNQALLHACAAAREQRSTMHLVGLLGDGGVHAFLRETLEHMNGRVQLASLSGRYYGMDRDNRWERTGLWYNAAVRGDGPHSSDALAYVQQQYDAGVTDEFVKPVVMTNADGAPLAPMHDGDVVEFRFNV